MPEPGHEPGAGAGRARSRLVPLAVVALFVLPILIAWWLATAPPAGLMQDLVNRGTLLTPPIDADSEPDLGALGAVPLGPGEWAAVTLAGGACEARCAAAVGRLLDVRTVLGQAATRLRVVSLTDLQPAPRDGVVAVADAAARSALSAALAGRELPGEAVVILDWRGQIVIFFDLEAPPDDVKKDLGRLLRASKVR